jgi:hypothetical protein
MIFDRELCFVYEGAITAFTTGAVGDALDLGADNQTGKGRPSYVAIACDSDMTATGNPSIELSLLFSDDAAFTAPVEAPLSLPPLGKGDFAKGKVIGELAPLLAKRYVKLKITTDIALTCASFTAGFVLDLQTNK